MATHLRYMIALSELAFAMELMPQPVSVLLCPCFFERKSNESKGLILLFSVADQAAATMPFRNALGNTSRDALKDAP